MSEYVLSCESTADLPAEKLKAIDVECIFFHFFIDGVEYPDDLGQTVPYDKFYQAMVDGADTKTSAISTGEYNKFFRSFLEQGKDVLHLSLSSGLSSTVDSARIAADELAAEFPERKIYIVDSLAASAGYGLLMDTLSELREEGKDIDELHDWVEENKLNLRHDFFSTDLTFFVKGGRVKPTAGFVGNLLKICPLLDVDFEGHLIPREKVRTKKKVVARIVEKMTEQMDDAASYAGKVFISESACLEDAKAVAALVQETCPNMNGEVEISSIGTTIGSHTGPGTVALFYWGTKRSE